MLMFMSLYNSSQSNPNVLEGLPANVGFSVEEFGFDDFSGCDAGELIKLALQVNDVRQRAESYLSAVLVRLGDLEGDEAVAHVCKQFGLPAYKTRRRVRTVKGLASMPDVVRAAKHGWITQDHAELIAASNNRASLSVEEQLDLLAVGVQQTCDDFKNTLLEAETQRLAAQGLNPTEQQHKRRTAKIFDSDDDMVVLHAELDQLAGEQIRTAIDAMTTQMFKQDYRTGRKRSYEQRNADALVTLITHTTSRNQTTNPKTTNTNPADAASSDETPELIPQQTTNNPGNTAAPPT